MHTYRSATLTLILALGIIAGILGAVDVANWVLLLIGGMIVVLLIHYFWGPQIERWFRRNILKAPHPKTNWHEFKRLPLKWAACLWLDLPPTDESLQDPRVQERLNRLSLAVRQRKLEHPDSLYYAWSHLPSYNPNLEDVEFSKTALAQYAEKENGHVPDFLRSD